MSIQFNYFILYEIGEIYIYMFIILHVWGKADWSVFIINQNISCSFYTFFDKTFNSCIVEYFFTHSFFLDIAWIFKKRNWNTFS